MQSVVRTDILALDAEPHGVSKVDGKNQQRREGERETWQLHDGRADGLLEAGDGEGRDGEETLSARGSNEAVRAEGR